MNKSKRKCPYCDTDVSYFETLSEMSVGEHTCPVCNKNSNIHHSKKIYIPAAILLAVAVAITFIIFFLGDETNLILTFIIIIIPFIIFFLLTPFYYSLSPIKSEAITPVVRRRVKSKKRSEITPRAVKYEEQKRLEREQKIMESKPNSFKNKLINFIKTYIVVDDDEEVSSDKADIKSLPQKSKDNLTAEKKVEFDQYPDIDTIDPLAEEDEDFSAVGVYTDKSAYDKYSKKEPVYHKLNKKTNVDFVYISENPDYIYVDLSNPDEYDDDEEINIDELDEEERENEEILSFFQTEPNDEKLSDFGSEKYNTQAETEKIEPSEEKVKIFSYSADISDEISIADNEEKDIAEENNFTESTLKDGDQYSENAEEIKEIFYSKDDFATNDLSGSFKDVSKNLHDNDKPDEKNTAENYKYELDLSQYKTKHYVEQELKNDKNIKVSSDISESIVSPAKVKNDKPATHNKPMVMSEIPKKKPAIHDKPMVMSKTPKKKPATHDKQIEIEESPGKESQKIKKAHIENTVIEHRAAVSEKPVDEQQKTVGFLSKVKEKLIEATEAEREEVFLQEERERKLAEKEARKKAKEKEKARQEKEKARQEKEKARQEKENNSKISQKSNTSRNEKKSDKQNNVNSQKEGSKQNNTAVSEENINRSVQTGDKADDNTKVFSKAPSKPIDTSYKAQEKIVLESVKDKVAEMENRRLTDEDKLKIIAERQKEEKKRKKIEQLKAEKEKQRVQKEENLKSQKLQFERQQKVDEIRRIQAEKAMKRQERIKRDSQRRTVSAAKLTDVDKVRTKVSQKQEHIKQQVDDIFND